MSLAPGMTLSSYRITGALGAGGMGEVYRATDTKLGREVALKLLPAALAADPDRIARFEREARMLAALNHPGIAHLYGVETAALPDGTTAHALVMELVPGEDLAVRLKRGRLPVDEAIAVARQVAEALEEAHEKGIVHRDLKPGNVKLTPDGRVKVLDFGLARAWTDEGAAATSSAELSQSPTLAHTGTAAGLILGTAAYMSPEQARGRPADRRADVWALGVLLYEMLTGRRLFEGETVSDVLAAVLRQEVDYAALPAETPPAVRRLLRQCLARDPKSRLHHAADARLALEEAAADGGTAVAPPAAARSPWLGRAGALALLLAALGAAAFVGRRTAPEAAGAGSAVGGFRHFTRLTLESGLESSPALSPDGEFVAYAASDGGDRDILLLRVGGQRPINLTGDSAADEDHPAFSPDGRQIAFRSERGSGGLFVMGATGESVRRLTSFGDNPAWSPDGREIVFATEGESDPHARERTSELWVVAAAGGEPRKIYDGDAVQPAWSPGGHRIAFWAVGSGGARTLGTIARDGSDPRPITAGGSIDWNPVWAPGGAQLYFESDRGGVMGPWRVAIDERTGRPSGTPEPIVLPAGWSGQLSLSADAHRLAYRTSEITAELQRFPFDARGAKITGPPERVFTTAIPAFGFDLSADGWIVFRTMAMQEDVYVIRVDGSGLRRLTDDAAKDRNPGWSPDGRQVAFYSNRSGRYEVWTVDRDGSGLRQRTNNEGQGLEQSVLYPLFSPDGRSIVATVRNRLFRFTPQNEPLRVADLPVIPVDRGDADTLLPLSWSPDGESIACIPTGGNGQVLGGIIVHHLPSGRTRFVRIDVPAPTGHGVFPTLAWLPDSRRGVVRWGDRILLVDVTAGTTTPLLTGLGRVESIVRLSGDLRWLYMLDSRDEGDLWLASRDALR